MGSRIQNILCLPGARGPCWWKSSSLLKKMKRTILNFAKGKLKYVQLHAGLKFLNNVPCPTYAGQQLVPNERQNYQEFKIYCVCLALAVLLCENRPPFPKEKSRREPF